MRFLIPWHFRIDVLEELRGLGFVPATIEPVRRELSSLMKNGSAGAGVALHFQRDVKSSKPRMDRP